MVWFFFFSFLKSRSVKVYFFFKIGELDRSELFWFEGEVSNLRRMEGLEIKLEGGMRRVLLCQDLWVLTRLCPRKC